jgi:voltage-gated potassium channel
LQKYKKRIFEIIQMGQLNDLPSRSFDIFIAITICLNLFVTIFGTFDESEPYKKILYGIELITVIVFIVEYMLRIWTAEYLEPEKTRLQATRNFVFSFFGIVDLITIVVFFLPFASSGLVAFRMLRVVRIFNLFKLNKYNDSLKIITNVLKEKRDQIYSSIFIIVVLMIASSLMMYSIENKVQPDVFENAFSGIWWSVSTLLTVGYGDIYPITVVGKLMAIVISFLGVGLVAIPTGIISAGFVEHHTKLKTQTSYMDETNIRFIVIKITSEHSYVDKKIKEINMPQGLIISTIIRDEQPLLPSGDIIIEKGDRIVVAAEGFKDDVGIKLKEITIKEEHPWVGSTIKSLDISRQTLIIVIRRKNKIIIPQGDTVIQNGDIIVVYTKKDMEELLEGIEIDL